MSLEMPAITTGHDESIIQEVGEGNKAPPEWLGEIEPTFLSYEAVPVLNVPFFNEVQHYRYKALGHARLLAICNCIATHTVCLHCRSSMCCAVL